MKITLSIPKKLFEQAEEMSRRLSISRSELYTLALRQFLINRDGTTITRRLNEVYGDMPAEIDPILAQINLRLCPGVVVTIE